VLLKGSLALQIDLFYEALKSDMHVRIVRTVHHLAVREHYTLGIFNFNFVVAQLFADVVRLFLFSLVGLHQRIEEPLSLASLFILLFRSQARGVALNLLKV
jgi:hypothetical protein